MLSAACSVHVSGEDAVPVKASTDAEVPMNPPTHWHRERQKPQTQQIPRDALPDCALLSQA